MFLSVNMLVYHSQKVTKVLRKFSYAKLDVGSDDGPKIVVFSPLSILFLMSFKDVSF